MLNNKYSDLVENSPDKPYRVDYQDLNFLYNKDIALNNTSLSLDNSEYNIRNPNSKKQKTSDNYGNMQLLNKLSDITSNVNSNFIKNETQTDTLDINNNVNSTQSNQELETRSELINVNKTLTSDSNVIKTDNLFKLFTNMNQDRSNEEKLVSNEGNINSIFNQSGTSNLLNQHNPKLFTNLHNAHTNEELEQLHEPMVTSPLFNFKTSNPEENSKVSIRSIS